MGTTDSQNTATADAVIQQVRLVFDRMYRQIDRVGKDRKPENIHRFRTNSRRVEVLVDQLSPENGNKRRLLNRLSKLRRKAGKVRDLDVQIAFLKELRVPDRQNHRAQLLDALAKDQERRSKRLAKTFDAEEVRKLRKRLRKAQQEMNLKGIDPLKLAFNHLPKPGNGLLTEKVLHACRISAKHARYLAELDAESPTAKRFVEELKKAQDEIGHWHDVLKLTERAEKLFGGVRQSSLVSALQNIGRAQFRRASGALQTALRTVSELEQRIRPSPESRPQPVPASMRVAA
jgi:CHAD domain-containing protein